jgi:CcmD family protein
MWRVTTAVLLSTAWTVALAAQTPSTTEFVPVKPGDLGQESVPAARLVFAAYAFVWLALVVYVFFLWRRVRRVERDLSEVAAKVGVTGR